MTSLRRALAFLLAATPALAQQPSLDLSVDNLRRAGSTVHAILRLANKSEQAYRSVQISCAFLSHGRAIDTSDELVPNIEAAETVYMKVIGPIGADAASVDEARCRVTNVH
jgi:hypothetical protein